MIEGISVKVRFEERFEGCPFFSMSVLLPDGMTVLLPAQASAY